MVRKKIDNRLRILIENGVAEKHRSMFVVVVTMAGTRLDLQVGNLYQSD